MVKDRSDLSVLARKYTKVRKEFLEEHRKSHISERTISLFHQQSDLLDELMKELGRLLLDEPEALEPLIGDNLS